MAAVRAILCVCMCVHAQVSVCCTLLCPKPLNPSGKQHCWLCNSEQGRGRQRTEGGLIDSMCGAAVSIKSWAFLMVHENILDKRNCCRLIGPQVNDECDCVLEKEWLELILERWDRCYLVLLTPESSLSCVNNLYERVLKRYISKMSKPRFCTSVF